MADENNRGWSFFATIVVLLVLGIIVFLIIGWLNMESRHIEIPETASEEESYEEGFGTKLGQKAINFTMSDQNGDNVSLYDYEGSIILLDFSSAWCEPCRDQAEESMNLYSEMEDKGFVSITILLDNMQHQPATLEDAKEWARTYGITYPVLTGNAEWVWNKYNEENAVPLNLVIDRNLTILYKQTGYEQDEIKRTLTQLLNR